MSLIWLPRSPAFEELRPKNPVWSTVEPELASQIRVWTGLQGEVLHLGDSANFPNGYYSIKNQSSCILLKIFPKQYLEQHLASDKIAHWLATQGVYTSCVLADYPKEISEQKVVIFAYEKIAGRFVKPNKEEMESVGVALAQMHKAFLGCEWANEIRRAGMQRHESTITMLKLLQLGTSKVKVPKAVKQILQTVNVSLLNVLIESPQVIHGDLNYGNLLVREDDHRIFFLDFEDTWTAWFSPLMDVAFVIERFALLESDEESLVLAKSFLDSYRSVGGSSFQGQTHLRDCLAALAVRALLLLSLVAENDKKRTSNAEWCKFIMLYEQSQNRQDLLNQIVS